MRIRMITKMKKGMRNTISIKICSMTMKIKWKIMSSILMRKKTKNKRKKCHCLIESI